jgi:antitoxin component of MazEF toxin-antitoxin module
MFIEKKKVITVGNSLAVTLKGNVGIMLQQGEEVEVEYLKNKIIIRRSLKDGIIK